MGLHDDVAWQHCADLILDLERLVGHGWIAGAQDEIGPEVHANLGLKGLLNVDLGDVEGVAATPTDPNAPPDDATAADLLAEADSLFDEAEQALQAGDLGKYQDKVEAARELVQRALDLLNA